MSTNMLQTIIIISIILSIINYNIIVLCLAHSSFSFLILPVCVFMICVFML